MDEKRAREILGHSLSDDGRILGGVDEAYAKWPLLASDRAKLDGDFTADALEAIAWWMRNK